MIVDTSAWVEFLRGTGSPEHVALRSAVAERRAVLVPEVVAMELLAGVSGERAATDLRRLLHSFEVVSLAPITDTEAAARLQRQCRRAGVTVRSIVDCLVAATAIRLDQPVLHRDRAFSALAAHSDLKVVAA
ncbi:MAG: type II toxin-antitoxin system VapC family toxin [Acidimicrobiales bacterium]